MPEITFVILEILRAITWPGAHAQAEQLVFQNQEELAKVWNADMDKNKLSPRPELPKVDFDKETVLAVFAGEKRTGGYKIKIEKVLQDKDNNVAVLYRASAPKPGGVVTQSFTYPRDVAVIKKVAGKVQFVNVDSAEGKKYEEWLKQK